MSIADILDDAANSVECGWIQGSWRSGNCVCAGGAIADAAKIGFARDGHPAMMFFAATLPEQPSGKRRIPYWNDAAERTQPEVVAKLREAAAKAREQGL